MHGGAGCRVQGSCRVQGVVFRVQDSVLNAQHSAFRVQGSVFSFWVEEFRAQRVQG
jgi:hypothetical protein